MFGDNWSPGKIWVSFLGAGTLLHSFALASGSLSGPGIADQHGGCPVSQRSEGIQQRRLHPGGCNHATELWGFARSGEGETDRAGEAAGLLAEVSNLPSPIGSQGINSYSLVENSELWGMRSDHPTRKTPQLMCLPWEDTDLHYKMKSPSCGKRCVSVLTHGTDIDTWASSYTNAKRGVLGLSHPEKDNQHCGIYHGYCWTPSLQKGLVFKYDNFARLCFWSLLSTG